MKSAQMETSKHLHLVNLPLIELLAKNKKRNSQMLQCITWLFVVSEYFLYLFVFFRLFYYKIVSDYPNLKFTDPLSWIQLDIFNYYMFLLSLVFIIYSSILYRKNLFKIYQKNGFLDDIFSIIKAVFISFLISFGVLFLLKTSNVYSRIFIVTFSLSMVLVAIFIRTLKLLLVAYLKKSSLFTKNVLIIGAGKVGERIHSLLSNNKLNGYKVVGFLDDYKLDQTLPIIGKIGDLEKIVQNERIDEIYITIPSERKIVSQLITRIRKYDLDITIIPELYDFVTSTINLQPSSDYPYFSLVKTPLRGVNLFLKRLVDILLSSFGIILIIPVFIITAIAINLDSKGPIFFKQKRIGKNGMPFSMYKFRSMVINAEELKSKLNNLNEAEGPVFKIKKDPRITTVGRFIRKYSLDELPQLFNVLKGEMSLIGPRPPLPNEVEQYDDYQWRRLDIVPGITGLWQVSGRSNLSFDDWVNLDIYYIENWSIAFDIKILLRTIPAVINGRGSY